MSTKNTSVATTPSGTPLAESTSTSTSTTTENVIPDEPGKLSALARLEDVETITVGDEELDVVVKGDELPSDARAGARALEAWLGGRSHSATWETFASDDPDADGWRWAAISQKTGTVVYIR